MKILRTALVAALVAGLLFAAVPTQAQARSGPNIVELAVAANSEGQYAGLFDILIALVTDQPAIASTLSGKGQFTVFAPVDSAFVDVARALSGDASLDEDGAKSFLLGADDAFVADVLLYHVARGNRGSAAVLGSSQIRMLNGDFAAVDGGAGTIDGAPIIVTDLRASNGVVHVVSAVLVP